MYYIIYNDSEFKVPFFVYLHILNILGNIWQILSKEKTSLQHARLSLTHLKHNLQKTWQRDEAREKDGYEKILERYDPD